MSSERLQALKERIGELAGDDLLDIVIERGEVTADVRAEAIHDLCLSLRDKERFAFDMLIDLCGIDFLTWRREAGGAWSGDRFGVVYHLLSTGRNQRLRLRAFVSEDTPLLASVVDIWPSANWFEREAFDLYGILFEGHPDLRRILTDYGFIGHPFRKDFPISGHVEMRYDEEKRRVVYEPVSIEPRINQPRVIREEGYGA